MKIVGLVIGAMCIAFAVFSLALAVRSLDSFELHPFDQTLYDDFKSSVWNNSLPRIVAPACLGAFILAASFLVGPRREQT